MTFPSVEFVDEKGGRWQLRLCNSPDNYIFISNDDGESCIPLSSIHKLVEALTAIQAAMAAGGKS